MLKDCLIKEMRYKTSRSSGPGGQHVNKTESRVEVYWDLYETGCLSESQKQRLVNKLSHRLSDSGILSLACETHRSQHRNREEVTERLVKLITGGLAAPKKRHRTKPTRASIEKRLQEKKRRGEVKRLRGKQPGE